MERVGGGEEGEGGVGGLFDLEENFLGWVGGWRKRWVSGLSKLL